MNTIRAWLGHAKPETTMIYAELDLETKAHAIACSEGSGHEAKAAPWRADKGLMAFLRSL